MISGEISAPAISLGNREVILRHLAAIAFGAADPGLAGRMVEYPPPRFAEFGILPGCEFPSEPATVRLLGDRNEESPVTAARRFGIYQFMPDAPVYARARRWKVIGLDTSSPWNPRTDAPWTYVTMTN